MPTIVTSLSRSHERPRRLVLPAMISAFLVALSAFGMFYKPSPLQLVSFAIGVATLTTIVVRWLAEAGRLRQAAHQLLAETLSDGLIVVDTTGAILDQNAAAAALLGRDAPVAGQLLGAAARDRSLGTLLRQALEDHLAQAGATTIQAVPARQLTIEIRTLADTAQQPIGALMLLRTHDREPAAPAVPAAPDQLGALRTALGRPTAAPNLLPTLTERIAQALALPAVSIASYDLALHDLVIVAERRQPPALATTGQRVPWQAGELAEAWRAGRLHVLESPQASPASAALYELLRYEPHHALALVPLLAGEQPIGMLILASERAERFDQPTLQLAQLIGSYAALALDNAQMQVASRQASRTKSAILDTISHEFRTPITAILGFAELFQEQSLGPVSEDQAQALEAIERNTYRLLRLVEDLLDLARLEAGNLELTPAPVNIELCLQEVLTVLKPQLAQRPGALRITVEPGLPRVWADALWLRRALQNLLSYTLQTHSAGAISLHASATPADAQAPSGRAVQITIASERAEPADELPADYFEPFHPQQAGQPQTHTTARIGLAISKHAIEAMGGQLAIERMRGQGQQYLLLLRGAAGGED